MSQVDEAPPRTDAQPQEAPADVPEPAPAVEAEPPKPDQPDQPLGLRIENLLRRHASEEHSAETYVEMPDVVVPEYQQESGEDKKATKERMAKLAAKGAVGFGTTAMGVGLRDLGYAIAKAGEDKEKNGGKINVKNIAKQADRIESRSKYKLEDLQGKQIPGVDPHLKEEYLADEYFIPTFGVDREAFEKLPAWKKQQLKKKANLF